MKSRALAILAGLLLCVCLPASAGSLIPSEASGIYSGNGWTCSVSAQLVPASGGLQPQVGFVCIGPAGIQYWAQGGRQQYAYECPRATELGDATTASIWPLSPPWSLPVGAITVRSYDAGNPAVLVVDVVAPDQPPARIALGRTQVTQIAAPYQYACNASGVVVTVARKRDW